MTAKMLLVGCGKMGTALLQRTVNEFTTAVIDPVVPTDANTSYPGVVWHTALDRLDHSFKPDIVLLAIKPQIVAKTLPAYGRFKDSVFLSIVAGQTLERLRITLGEASHALVRAMPNLPASIGQGITVAIAGTTVNPPQKRLCEKLLQSVGEVAWAEDEAWLDVVTALSGSGPAYVFALIEVLAKSGEQLGLPAALAAQLARKTVIGSGALLAQSSDRPDILRTAVTSPGGTTEAALKVLLNENGLEKLMYQAMQAAVLRAKELAQG